MTAAGFLFLLFQFATEVRSGPGDLVLQADVFRGIGGSRTGGTRPVASTTMLAPWASGWSNDVERLSTELRDVRRLDRARLVLREQVSQEKKTATIRGSSYWIAVRFLPAASEKVEMEVRLIRDGDAVRGGAALPAVRVSAQLDRPFVVESGDGDELLLAAFTLKDPLELLEARPVWPPQPLEPIRPKYPQPAAKTTRPGRIVVKALVDVDGSVVEPFVLEGLQPDLDAAALEALRRARFRPARVREKPTATMISVACTFQPVR
jgi:protein TonB